MKVCIMGLGYIGFPTACVIARAGHDVLGVDVNQSLVNKLNSGELHIGNEPGLTQLAREAFNSGRLKVSTVPHPADVFIIAVPTPFQNDDLSQNTIAALQRAETDYRADLDYVAAAARAIAPTIRPGSLVVVESTVPPHTTERVVVGELVACGVNTDGILFAHAPERVLPGNIVHELIHNDRIVGGLTSEASRKATEFYRTFVKGQVVVTDATTAELIKLMENTFRDVNIALSNEFAVICERLGIDVWEAIRLANLHPRVNFLRPGPGVGGHCIAVDPYFLIEAAPALTPLIQVARRVNRHMPLHVLRLFERLTQGTPVEKVALLGAAYKANVGDHRESPSLEIARLLSERGLQVDIHDPYVEQFQQPLEVVVDGADVIIIGTDHRDYTDIIPANLAEVVAHRLLLDTRGIVDAHAWRSAGFTVMQLGVEEPKGLLVGA